MKFQIRRIIFPAISAENACGPAGHEGRPGPVVSVATMAGVQTMALLAFGLVSAAGMVADSRLASPRVSPLRRVALARQPTGMQRMCASPAAPEPQVGDEAATRKELKGELREVVAPLRVGFDATPEQQSEVLEIVEELETFNPTPEPLKSPGIAGKWNLIYTSSPSVRGVQGVMGVNQWFRDASMTGFVQDVRIEPNYMKYVETVEFPGLVASMVGNVAVAEGFWTIMEDEPNTMVTDANKVTVGPMKYDSDQWQSLRCLMIQDVTYLDEDLRIQHGLVPNIIFVFERMPEDTVLADGST